MWSFLGSSNLTKTDANGNTTTTTTTTTNGETTTETTESSSEQETSSVAGTYSHTYTEEMDGSELEFTETVVLKDDGTCEVTFQDTILGTWAEDKITLDDGSSFEFSVEDNTLSLNRDGEWISFNK